MPKSKNAKYSVPNLERALKILELLSKNSAGLTTAQICEKLKYPRNSVFRITSTLQNNEYLIRNEETKEFQLTLKLLNMGYAAIGDETLIEKALPMMKELRDKIGETVPLGILHGDEGIVIEEVPGAHSFRFVLEPGKKFNLHTAAPAKAILAFLPNADLESKISKIKFEKFTDRTITNLNDYKICLDKVRNCGYAIDYAEEIEGMHCISAPIFNRKGFPIAAIWITGPSRRISSTDFDKIGEEVKKHAKSISKSFGYGLINGVQNDSKK
jgi:DNA-binding IclR family transcriptional regulator